MVADSITDSELYHRSPILRDFSKKRKTNWFLKLKQWKIDARRKQWIYQSWRVDHEEGLYDYDDDDIDLDRTLFASSPTSVLKNKDSEECFCCSKPFTAEEVCDDAVQNWEDFRDALNDIENDRNEERRINESRDFEKEEEDKCKQETSPQNTIHGNDKKESEHEGSECPICFQEMDATDLTFLPCPCGFRLCLFCYKNIIENNGRCPACRNKYDGQTYHNSEEVSFQQRGRGTLRLSSTFRELDKA